MRRAALVAPPILVALMATMGAGVPAPTVEATPDDTIAYVYEAAWQATPLPAITAGPSSTFEFKTPSIVITTPAPRADLAVVYAAGVAQIGTPYIWGAETPGVGFDCSGFVSYAYASARITIPRGVADIRAVATVITADEALPGDILYWPPGSTSATGPNGHVALYAGPGLRLDANHRGDVVNIRAIYGSPIYLRIT